jgi:hypothetical protein
MKGVGALRAAFSEMEPNLETILSGPAAAQGSMTKGT